MTERKGEGLTFEKVWAMFQESGRRMEETERLLKESMAETDRQFQESGRRMEESDRRLKESMAETERFLKASSEGTDRKIKEVSEEGKKTFRALKKASRIVGDLGNKFGKLSEHLIVPNMVKKFNGLGYKVSKAGRNIEILSPDKTKTLTEIDLLLENGDVAIIVEVKSDLSEKHIERHVKRMEKLRRYWDEHNDRRKLIGAVAGAIMEAGVKSLALEMGFYVIVQSGDTVHIEAPEGFTPKMW
jgi:hypothetical protein